MESVKELRREENGLILADQEIIVTAIAAYWTLVEQRNKILTCNQVHPQEDIYHFDGHPQYMQEDSTFGNNVE